MNMVSVLNPWAAGWVGDLIYWHSHQTLNCIKDRKSNNDILSSRVFSFRPQCVTDTENVSCGMEIRAGTGSANLTLIVKEQREGEALEI